MASFTQLNFGAIAVTGHYEKDKHTLYVVEGALSATQTWRCEKRLAELRALHDAVVAGVGRKGYEAHFKGASFASRGGMPGTTKKLDKWCKACTGRGGKCKKVQRKKEPVKQRAP